VTVELTEFDTDPMLLNCLNGTLRFVRPDDDGPARVELQAARSRRPADQGHRLRLRCRCAPAPLFQGLVKWAQPDRDRRRYLRQWLGYNLTGDMGEQIFHIWYGPLAANGKSTVGNACREAIGDYGDTTNVETFLDEGPRKHGDQATPAIVRLPGVRFLTAGEPPKGAKINEPLINSVTGGDPMLARDNFRSFFRFTPIFKFTLWCNDLPPIPQGTAGIWRRVKVMPWEQHLEPHERDRDLPKKLRPNMPASSPGWCAADRLDGARLRRARIGPARLGRLQARQRPAFELPQAVHRARPRGGCSRRISTRPSAPGPKPRARPSGSRRGSARRSRPRGWRARRRTACTGSASA
jgi:hypothetical protein